MKNYFYNFVFWKNPKNPTWSSVSKAPSLGSSLGLVIFTRCEINFPFLACSFCKIQFIYLWRKNKSLHTATGNQGSIGPSCPESAITAADKSPWHLVAKLNIFQNPFFLCLWRSQFGFGRGIEAMRIKFMLIQWNITVFIYLPSCWLQIQNTNAKVSSVAEMLVQVF